VAEGKRVFRGSGYGNRFRMKGGFQYVSKAGIHIYVNQISRPMVRKMMPR
jgi:hypothetical protein